MEDSFYAYFNKDLSPSGSVWALRATIQCSSSESEVGSELQLESRSESEQEQGFEVDSDLESESISNGELATGSNDYMCSESYVDSMTEKKASQLTVLLDKYTSEDEKSEPRHFHQANTDYWRFESMKPNNDELSQIKSMRDPRNQFGYKENIVGPLKQDETGETHLQRPKSMPVWPNCRGNDSFDQRLVNALGNLGERFLSSVGNLFDSGGGGILNSIIPRQSNLKLSHINTLIREYRKLELDTISPDNLGLNKTNDWLKHWESYPFGEPITAFGCWHDQGINNNMDDRWFIAQLTSGQLFGIFSPKLSRKR